MNDYSVVLFDLDTCVDLYLYIFSHFFFQRALKMSIFKRERAKKALLQKLVWLGKGGAKTYLKCMVPKSKAYWSKIYQNLHSIASQKLSCID